LLPGERRPADTSRDVARARDLHHGIVMKCAGAPIAARHRTIRTPVIPWRDRAQQLRE
jgi:hypothetical protein